MSNKCKMCGAETPVNAKGTKHHQFCSRICRSKHNSTIGKEKRKQTCMERYGCTTNLLSAETKDKIKKTNLEKYGATHAMKTADVKEKVALTKLKTYGDSAFNNRQKFVITNQNKTLEEKTNSVKKRKATVLAKFGVEHITQTDQFKHKAQETNLNRYGFANAAKSQVVKDRIAYSHKIKYGCHTNQQHISEDSLQKLSDINFLTDNNNRSLVSIAEELGVTYYTVGAAYDRLGVARTFSGYNTSQAEDKIAHFLETLGVKVIRNSRDLIGQKELDLYLPEKNIAIEFNGLYWHSELRGKDRSYHQTKYQAAKIAGISLIQITDYEWNNKQDIVKSRIRAKLGMSENRIFARNCVCREITQQEEKNFLNCTHIQGYTASKVRYGLFNNSELVAVMTFGKPRFNRNYEWELLRYSTKLNSTVIGAANKLFAHFLRKHSPKLVVSYSDLRWNTGDIYTKLGFAASAETKPNYWYTYQYTTLESRVKYQKHKLHKILKHFDPTKTEWENMVANGYDRFWDCGNKVFLWKKPVDN